MNKTRLEAFSDGVLAIIITITVLGVRVPDTPDRAGLMRMLPVLLIYAWSFQTVGTYWINHHHLLHATRQASRTIMWANLHLLFWLSLIPLTTEWLGLHIGAPWPTAAYCAVLLLSASAYGLLEQTIIGFQGRDSDLVWILGRRLKELVSLSLYAASVVTAFVNPWLSYALAVPVTVMWLIPGRRRLVREA